MHWVRIVTSVCLHWCAHRCVDYHSCVAVRALMWVDTIVYFLVSKFMLKSIHSCSRCNVTDSKKN